jgi:hypothetical protein
MAISTIRKLTTEDSERVEAAAKRFCLKRGIRPYDLYESANLTPVEDYFAAVLEWVDYNDAYYGDRNGVRAWRRAFARALRLNESKDLTIGYGYVGYRVHD